MKQVCFYSNLLCLDMIKLQGVYSFQFFNLTFFKDVAQSTCDRVVLLLFCALMTNQYINNIYRGYWIQHYMCTCWMTIFQKKKRNIGSSCTTSKQKVMQRCRLLYLLYLKLTFSSVIVWFVINYSGTVGLRILKMLRTLQNLFTFYWNRLDTSVYLCIRMIQVSYNKWIFLSS